MKPRKPARTESTFTSNQQVRANEGASDFKIQSGVRAINIALYDVDYAVKWHLESKINPTILENQAVLTVPIIFASGEKWTMIRKNGYLRDNQGKLLTPLIVIRRNSISKREDIQDLKVLETPDARLTFERRYTKNNKYDRFSLSGQSPVREFYSVDIPKFVQIEYELLIWTNNTQQLNEIVEQLMWWDGKAFGDSYKFITHIDPPTFESVNTPGDDRIVRANMSMRTKAHILNPKGPNAPAIYKLNPVNRVQFGLEVDSVIDTGQSLVGTPPQTQTSSPSVSPGPGSTTISGQTVTYLSTNHQLTGTVISTTTVTFNSGWLTAPGTLPNTSVDNFTFFVNGIFVEKTAIVSFAQSSNVSTLVINPTNLGYNLAVSDEVVGIGKFINKDNLA
jgi:hypothetical protein